MNKSYAQLPSSGEVLRLILVRFYQRLRFDTLEFIIILIGAIYFPLTFLKNKKGAWAIIASFVLLYLSIFPSHIFVHYYAIPYYAFVPLGFIVIAHYMSKYIQINFRWHLCLFFFLIALIVGIPYKQYFHYDGDILMRRLEEKNLVNQFGEHIEKTDSPTMLNLSLDNANALFTKYNMQATVRYFTSPNLTYEQYPTMRNEQTRYIENRMVDFIQISDQSFNYEYFNQLVSLHENYELIDKYSTTGNYATVHYLYRLKK